MSKGLGIVPVSTWSLAWVHPFVWKVDDFAFAGAIVSGK